MLQTNGTRPIWELCCFGDHYCVHFPPCRLIPVNCPHPTQKVVAGLRRSHLNIIPPRTQLTQYLSAVVFKAFPPPNNHIRRLQQRAADIQCVIEEVDLVVSQICALRSFDGQVQIRAASC